MKFISKQKFVRVTPDKVRILSSMIKGKAVEWSLSVLEFSGKVGATPLRLALKQARDQIKAKGLNLDDFTIETVQVDEGPKLKRRRIRHQGRSTMILKRMSHVTVVLTDEQSAKVKMKNTKKITEIETAKSEPKMAAKAKVTKGSK